MLPKMQVTRRSTCPTACALDIAGDRWTLLIVRDLLRGRDTYGKLAASDEGIPTNILADRLKKMEAAGLVEPEPYQERPVRRYALTEKGRDLGAVLAALARWGKKHVVRRGAAGVQENVAGRTSQLTQSNRRQGGAMRTPVAVAAAVIAGFGPGAVTTEGLRAQAKPPVHRARRNRRQC